MALKPETIFRKKVDQDLKTLKNSWFESIQQKCIRGTPDKLGCVNSFFVSLEFKATSVSPIAPLQKYNLAQILRAGGYGFIVTPDNWDIIFDVLKMLSEKIVKKRYPETPKKA